MRRLGGWQRLWVVFSLLSAIYIGVLVPNLFPQLGDIEHDHRFYEQFSAEAKAQLMPGEFASSADHRDESRRQWSVVVPEYKVLWGESVTESTSQIKSTNSKDTESTPQIKGTQVVVPNEHVIHLRDGVDITKNPAAIREYTGAINSVLTRKRAAFIGYALLFWAGISLATYAAGWAIGWVYRGFEKPQ